MGAADGVFTDVKGLDIEQGPEFLRMVSFLTAFGSLVCIVFVMVHPSELMHFSMYILKSDIAIFALTTMLFESRQEWIQSMGPVSAYQQWLMKHCEFLSLLAGRGAFYVFQGTLWLTFADSLGEMLEITIALALIIVGTLHFAAHYGLMPHDIKQRLTGGKVHSVAGYDIAHDMSPGFKGSAGPGLAA